MMGKSDESKPAVKTVAAVDSDPAVRYSLEFSLQAEGFRVIASALGQDLLTALDGKSLDCLVVEYRLQDMTGLELVEHLRKRDVHTPVIMLATHPSAALRSRAQHENIVLVEKPLVGNVLTDALHRLIG